MFKMTNLWRGLLGIFVIIFVVMMGMTITAFAFDGAINGHLNVQTSKIVPGEGDENKDLGYFKSDYLDDVTLLTKKVESLTASEKTKVEDALKELNDAQDKFVTQEMEESAVLLKNTNNALPLAASERKVSLLGHAVSQPLFTCKSGGGNNDPSRQINLYDAFDSAGFDINDTLYNAYVGSGYKRGSGAGFGSSVVPKHLGEVPFDFYTPDIKTSIENHGGIAIVMLAREGAEGADLDRVFSSAYGGDDDKHQLKLQNCEIQMLQMVKDYKTAGVFSKIIFLHNSPYAMELDWLDEYNIDAALHIGTAGLTGLNAIPGLLTGAVTPSGKLVDVFASNALSSPAVTNWVDKSFSNLEAKDVARSGSQKYMVLAEGIYTGYKYYETRYEDLVLGRYGADSNKGSSGSGKWNYADEVRYPFGYGLSYTTFTQKLNSVTGTEGSEISVSVTVENTGTVAGKSVVEVYAQTPYGDYEKENGVEKSAIQLVGFAKTDMLAPKGQTGSSQTLTVTVDKYLLASWDSKSNNGSGGYILSKGDYYLSIGDESHDALNNIIAKKKAQGKAASAVQLYDYNGTHVTGKADNAYHWEMNSLDDYAYRFSDETKVRVSNQYEKIDINHWLPGSVKYLTRSDWSGTFPTTVPDLAATDAMKAELNKVYEKSADATSAKDYTLGVQQGIKMVDMREVDWQDNLWNDFIGQLTMDELIVSIDDYFSIKEIESIAKPAQLNDDGPDGLQNTYKIKSSETAFATAYIGEATAACSWNTEMLVKRGNFIGEDALFCGLSQAWSPGANLHRLPFSGRNHEYYSEDANMNYLCIIPQTKAMMAKGISVGPKHFAGNDVELNRANVSLFQTEQTWRQNSLRGFEGAFTKGKVTSTMNAKNGLGLDNIGENYATMTHVLRNEWGFKGVVIADAGSGRALEAFVAGTDMWCLSKAGARGAAVKAQIENFDDGFVMECLLESSKRFYYAFSRSNLMNGLSSNSNVVSIYPWWKTSLIVVDIVLGVFALGMAVLYGISYFKKEGVQ